MKCKKCAKEYSEEFSFCPYCGTKKPGEKQRNDVPLLYTLPVLSDLQLEMVAEDLHVKSGEEIRTALYECNYPATVYVSRGELKRDGEKRWRVWELPKSTCWLKEEPWSNVRFCVAEVPYSRYMFQFVGRSVYRTREEAEEAITKAGYTRKDGAYWYAEDDDG